MSTRLEEIQNIIAVAPDDPFPRYGLAMEYKNLGRFDEAQAAFQELMASHPQYVPQYLMFGTLLIQRKQPDEARRVLTLGIQAAERARNQHALGELRTALASVDQPEEED